MCVCVCVCENKDMYVYKHVSGGQPWLFQCARCIIYQYQPTGFCFSFVFEIHKSRFTQV